MRYIVVKSKEITFEPAKMVVVTRAQVTLWTGCTAVRGWWVGWGGGEVIHAQTQTTVSTTQKLSD